MNQIIKLSNKEFDKENLNAYLKIKYFNLNFFFKICRYKETVSISRKNSIFFDIKTDIIGFDNIIESFDDVNKELNLVYNNFLDYIIKQVYPSSEEDSSLNIPIEIKNLINSYKRNNFDKQKLLILSHKEGGIFSILPRDILKELSKHY